ncbi:MAG: hypothetical protein ACXWM7_06015, partial [Parachlamydiaceae bacterium]
PRVVQSNESIMIMLLFATLTRHRNVELHFFAIHGQHFYLHHFKPKVAALSWAIAIHVLRTWRLP